MQGLDDTNYLSDQSSVIKRGKEEYKARLLNCLPSICSVYMYPKVFCMILITVQIFAIQVQFQCKERESRILPNATPVQKKSEVVGSVKYTTPITGYTRKSMLPLFPTELEVAF